MFDHIRAFHQPRTIKDAVRLLHKSGAKSCLVAGGTDLVLRAPRTVTALVDISRLGLSYIKREGKSVRIGATTTMAELEASRAIQNLADGILAQAASNCGGVQTRNMATIGGNLANASPAADSATPLLALDAEVVLRGMRGVKRVPLAAFFSGPHKSTADGSLLTEIIIPAVKPRSGFSLQRLARSERDLAIVSVAAGIGLDRQSRCVWARIALGAVAAQPIRALQAESVLAGQNVTRALLANAAEVATQGSDPISDVRASAEYRREMTRVLVRRALEECANRLECAL